MVDGLLMYPAKMVHLVQVLLILMLWQSWLIFFTAKGHPVFIILNYGSTFKGSYDDVELVGETLMPILKKNNMYERTIVMQDGKTETRKALWIHVDGAL